MICLTYACFGYNITRYASIQCTDNSALKCFQTSSSSTTPQSRPRSELPAPSFKFQTEKFRLKMFLFRRHILLVSLKASLDIKAQTNSTSDTLVLEAISKRASFTLSQVKTCTTPSLSLKSQRHKLGRATQSRPTHVTKTFSARCLRF